MAWELPSFKLPGFVAGANLSTHQYKAVFGSTVGTAVLATADGAILGILQNDPDTGFAAEIMNKGVSKAIAGGEITVHSRVEVGTDGKLVAFNNGIAVGIALEAAATDGDMFTVLLV